jgi:vacuolar-type H+-ATPase subunit H
MDSSTATTSEQPPLDQIRQAEAEVKRRIAAAQWAAETDLQEAHLRAEDLKRQARETGRCEGQMEYQDIIRQAMQDARALVAQAHRQAEDLRRRGELRMDSVARSAVAIVVGQEEDSKQNER